MTSITKKIVQISITNLLIASLLILFFCIFTDFIQMSFEFSFCDQVDFDINKFTTLTFFFRMSFYVLIPILSYWISRITFNKMKNLTIKDFYDNLFQTVTLISVVFILLALDLKYGFTIFNSSDAFLSLVGLNLSKWISSIHSLHSKK